MSSNEHTDRGRERRVVAMRPPQPPPHPDDPTGGPSPARPDAAGGEAVAGLAREVDALRRLVEPVAGVSGRVDELAGILTDLATTVEALSARKSPTPCPSWLLAPTDPTTVAGLVDGLRGWMEAVYLRYADAASTLPECWCWHPEIVEELLWLMHAWLGAYQGPGAAVGLVADWHDRYRPGVVRRIRGVAGSCSRERHQTRPGWDTPAGAPTVPAADATDAIITWWAAHRDEPGPQPADRDTGHARATWAGSRR